MLHRTPFYVAFHSNRNHFFIFELAQVMSFVEVQSWLSAVFEGTPFDSVQAVRCEVGRDEVRWWGLMWKHNGVGIDLFSLGFYNLHDLWPVRCFHGRRWGMLHSRSVSRLTNRKQNDRLGASVGKFLVSKKKWPIPNDWLDPEECLSRARYVHHKAPDEP